MGCGSTSHFRTTLHAMRVTPETMTVDQYEVYGSGFFVNNTGLALTAAHTLRGGIPGTVRAHIWWSGRGPGLAAAPVVVDWAMDLALIQVDVDRSTPASPLCSEVRRGTKMAALGAPVHKVDREKGVALGVSVEYPPCEAIGGHEGVGVKCASERGYMYTPGATLDQTSQNTLAGILGATSRVRPGFSGGSFRYKAPRKPACTAGVIIQMDTTHNRARAIHPLSSPSIAQYLFVHAPEFMQNFTN